MDNVRDHLANERTFLAWIRTGLALLGISVAFLKWQDISNVTAYIIASLGLMVFVLSTHRYFRVMTLLDRGEFKANIQQVVLVTSIATTAILLTFILHAQSLSS